MMLKSHTKVLRQNKEKEVRNLREFYYDIAEKSYYFHYTVGYLIAFEVLEVYFLSVSLM